MPQLADLFDEGIENGCIVWQLATVVEHLELIFGDGMDLARLIAVAKAHAVKEIYADLGADLLYLMDGTVNGAPTGLGFRFVDREYEKAVEVVAR